jgi:fatty acid desaturase
VKRHAELIREGRWHLAGYTAILGLSLAAHTDAALLLWLAPMVVMKFTHQMQNTIEHLGLPHAPNVLQNTRSTRTNAVLRWLCWQMQYHTAHHAFPGVPFHRLRELHETIFTARSALSCTARPRLTIPTIAPGSHDAHRDDARRASPDNPSGALGDGPAGLSRGQPR